MHDTVAYMNMNLLIELTFTYAHITDHNSYNTQSAAICSTYAIDHTPLS